MSTRKALGVNREVGNLCANPSARGHRRLRKCLHAHSVHSGYW